jgi:hypothetical protein
MRQAFVNLTCARAECYGHLRHEKLGRRRFPKNGTKKSSFHNRKVKHPAKDPQSSNLSIEKKNNTSIMAEEVYEGAIGIDLGEFSIAAQK